MEYNGGVVIPVRREVYCTMSNNDINNSGAIHSAGEIEIDAAVENLDKVLSFVTSHLEEKSCSFKELNRISLAVEEVFVNIANYAYSPEVGKARVRVEVTNEPVTVSITFIDHGKPYDPFARPDPDVSLSVSERKIGGLGVFLVKRTMDDVYYEYKDGCNILRLQKNL